MWWLATIWHLWKVSFFEHSATFQLKDLHMGAFTLMITRFIFGRLYKLKSFTPKPFKIKRNSQECLKKQVCLTQHAWIMKKKIFFFKLRQHTKLWVSQVVDDYREICGAWPDSPCFPMVTTAEPTLHSRSKKGPARRQNMRAHAGVFCATRLAERPVNHILGPQRIRLSNAIICYTRRQEQPEPSGPMLLFS